MARRIVRLRRDFLESALRVCLCRMQQAVASKSRVDAGLGRPVRRTGRHHAVLRLAVDPHHCRETPGFVLAPPRRSKESVGTCGSDRNPCAGCGAIVRKRIRRMLSRICRPATEKLERGTTWDLPGLLPPNDGQATFRHALRKARRSLGCGVSAGSRATFSKKAPTRSAVPPQRPRWSFCAQ